MAESEAITSDVLIAGAGPAGLLLARELQLAGVTAMVIDKLPARATICRGFTLNARSLDILARRNMLEPFLSEGWKVPHAAFSGLPVTPMLEGSMTDHPYSLGIGQDRVERLLEAEAMGSGVFIHWEHQLITFEQDDEGVTAIVAANGHNKLVRVQYLVGCDGSRSVVRKQAGIDFPGTAAKRIMFLADVELTEPDSLSLGINNGPGGSVFVIPRPGYVRIIFRDRHPPADKDRPVPVEEFASALSDVLGKTVAVRNPRWLTRFGDAARQAVRYVAGRVILAGDAAHIHPPAGAIGVNVALDDAFNLGWKLAATLRDGASARLLETYNDERHAAGKRVLENTQAQVLLTELSEDRKPLREFLIRLFQRPEVSLALAEVVTGLDTRYLSPSDATAHALLGRMVPDFALFAEGRETRLTELLHGGQWVLIDATDRAHFINSLEGFAPDIRKVHATSVPQSGPLAILVRPDGHAAWIWTGHSDDANALHEALAYWFSRS